MKARSSSGSCSNTVSLPHKTNTTHSSMEAYHLYHRSAELSDIEVVYSVTNTDPPDARAAKRRRQDEREAVTRYPAHKLCLSACSGVMRTEVRPDGPADASLCCLGCAVCTCSLVHDACIHVLADRMCCAALCCSQGDCLNTHTAPMWPIKAVSESLHAAMLL